MPADVPADVPADFVAPDVPNSFETLVGPIYEKVDDKGYVCGFRPGQAHTNRRGVVHGGMLFTLADHALGNIVWERVGQQPCATVSLNVDYVAGVKLGDWVECRGRVTRETRSLVFIKGELSVGDRVVMTATGVWKKLGAD